MKSFRLTKNEDGYYDLLIENGKFSMAEEGTQAAQHALQRLMTFKGELSLNNKLTTKTEEGTKWYEIIFDMTKSQAEKELEIKSRLLTTPGVEKILRFNWSQTGHTVNIDASIQTSWGEESISEEITLL